MGKVSLLRILAVAALVVLATGCSIPGTSTNTTNATAVQIAAKDLAMSIADPTTGTTQEITDLGSCFFGAWGLNPVPWSLFRASNFALYLYSDGFLSKKLVWNSTNNDYEFTESRTVTAGPISGTAKTLTIAVAFFTSTDASGTGVQIDPLTPDTTPFSSIHSITYSRQLQSNFTNSTTGVQRQLSSTTSFTVTNLTVTGSTPGFSVTGTRTDNFTDTYSNGTTVKGSFTETIGSSATPIVVTAVLQSNGSYLVTATGTIQVAYTATITQANGTTSTVSNTSTITLNGKETVYINMNGTRCSVDMTTGETE